MKTIIALAVLSFTPMSPLALANQPLNGTYRAMDSEGCANQSIDSIHEITVLAKNTGIEVDQEGSQEALYDFQVGQETGGDPSFFNEFVFVLTGSYSMNGTQFKAVETIRDRLNPTVQSPAGEADLTLKNNVLEIDYSLPAQGQPAASPVSSCFLNQVRE